MARQTVKIKKAVGQQIQAERLKRGWSQKDLARETDDVSTKWISRVENNQVNAVDVVHLNRVANALGISPTALLADAASEHQPGEQATEGFDPGIITRASSNGNLQKGKPESFTSSLNDGSLNAFSLSQSKENEADAHWKDWVLTHAVPALIDALDDSAPTKVLAAFAALKEIDTPAATQAFEAFAEQLLTVGHTPEQIKKEQKKCLVAEHNKKRLLYQVGQQKKGKNKEPDYNLAARSGVIQREPMSQKKGSISDISSSANGLFFWFRGHENQRYEWGYSSRHVSNF